MAFKFGNKVKSLGNTIFESLFPDTKATALNIQMGITDISNDFRNTKVKMKSSITRISKAGGPAAMFNQAIEDIVGGDYDPEGLSDSFSDDLDDLGLDDLDFGNDESPSSDGDVMSDTPSSYKTDKVIEASTYATLAATEEQTNALANTVLNVGKASQQNMTSMLMAGFGNMSAHMTQTSNILEKINQNIATMMNHYNEVNKTMYEAKNDFQEKLLQKIESISTPYQKKEKAFNLKDDPFSGGSFDLNTYYDMVKKNFSESTPVSMFEMFRSMMRMDKSAKLSDMIIPMIIGSTKIGKATNKLDSTIHNVLKTALMRIGDMSDDENIFKSAIGSIFGINGDKLSAMNLGKYNKEATAWNGKDSYALQHVIPTYLASIDKAVNNRESAYRFDYDTAQFVTDEKLMKDFKSEISNTISMALWDVKNKIDSALQENGNPMTKDEISALYNDLSDSFKRVVTSNKNFDKDEMNKVHERLRDAGLTKTQIQEIIQGASEGLNDAKTNVANKINNLNEDTTDMDVYRNLFNGFENKGLIRKSQYMNEFSGKLFSDSFIQDIQKKESKENLQKTKLKNFGNSISTGAHRFISKIPFADNVIDGFNAVNNGVSHQIDKLGGLVGSLVQGWKDSEHPLPPPPPPIPPGAPVGNGPGDDSPIEKDPSKLGLTKARRGNTLRSMISRFSSGNLQASVNSTIGGDLGSASTPEEDMAQSMRANAAITAALHDKLTGQNGILEKFFGKDGLLGKAMDFVFGKKNERGYREGTSLSHIYNKGKDFAKGGLQVFTGMQYMDRDGIIHEAPDNSVAKTLRGLGKKAYNQLPEKFRDKIKNNEKIQKIKESATNFMNPKKDDTPEKVEEIKKKVASIWYRKPGADGKISMNRDEEDLVKWLWNSIPHEEFVSSMNQYKPDDYIYNPSNQTRNANPDLSQHRESNIFSSKENRKLRRKMRFMYGNKLSKEEIDDLIKNQIYDEENNRTLKGPNRVEGAIKAGAMGAVNGGVLPFKKPHVNIVSGTLSVMDYLNKTRASEADIESELENQERENRKLKGIQGQTFTVKRRSIRRALYDAQSGLKRGSGNARTASNRIEHLDDEVNNAVDRMLYGDMSQVEALNTIDRSVKNAAPPKKLINTLTAGTLGAMVPILTKGRMGLLGAFMPHGIFGNAILASAMYLLSQNKTFTKMALGDIDEKTGQRTGGFISKSLQDKFNKHKKMILGGAIGGGLLASLGVGTFLGGSTLGVLGSMLLPGGVIGGAVLGIGASLLAKTDTFQKMMFGRKGAKGQAEDTASGFHKITNKIRNGLTKNNEAVKRGLLGAGIGFMAGKTVLAHGLLGATLGVGGPIGLALAGTALGIASTSEDFKSYILGSMGTDGKRKKNGLTHRLGAWMESNMLQPATLWLKKSGLNIGYWFQRQISHNLRLAFGPLMSSLSLIAKNVQDKTKDIIATLTGGIAKTFRAIFNPIGKLMGRLVKGTGKVLGGTINVAAGLTGQAIAMPFKLLAAISSPYRAKQEAKFKKDYYKNDWKEKVSDQKGIFGKIKGAASFVKDNIAPDDEAKAHYFQKRREYGDSHDLSDVTDWWNEPARMYDLEQTKKEEKKKLQAEKLFNKERMQFLKSDKYIEDRELTTKEREKRIQFLQRHGVDTSLIRSDKDIQGLLYRFNDTMTELLNQKEQAEREAQRDRNEAERIERERDQEEREIEREERERQEAEKTHSFRSLLSDKIDEIKNLLKDKINSRDGNNRSDGAISSEENDKKKTEKPHVPLVHFKRAKEKEESSQDFNSNIGNEPILGFGPGPSAPANRVKTSAKTNPQQKNYLQSLYSTISQAIQHASGIVMEDQEKKEARKERELEKRNSRNLWNSRQKTDMENASALSFKNLMKKKTEDDDDDNKTATLQNIKPKEEKKSWLSSLIEGAGKFLFGGLGQTLLLAAPLLIPQVREFLGKLLKPILSTGIDLVKKGLSYLPGLLKAAFAQIPELVKDIFGAGKFLVKELFKGSDDSRTYKDAKGNEKVAENTYLKDAVVTTGVKAGARSLRKGKLGNALGKGITWVSNNLTANKAANEAIKLAAEKGADEAGQRTVGRAAKKSAMKSINKAQREALSNVGFRNPRKGLLGALDEFNNLKHMPDALDYIGNAKELTAKAAKEGADSAFSKAAEKGFKGSLKDRAVSKVSQKITGMTDNVMGMAKNTTIGKGITNGIDFVKSKAGSVLGKADDLTQAGLKKGKDLVSAAFDKAKGMADNLSAKMFKHADDAGETVSAIAKIGAEATDDIDDTMGVVRKMVKYIQGGFDKLLESKAAQKLLSNELLQKIIKKVKPFFDTILEAGKDKLAKYTTKIQAAFAKASGSSAALAVPVVGHAIQAIMTTWDAVSGAMDADRIFHVRKEDVNWIMTTVSSLLNVLLGIGPIAPILDIASEIVAELSSLDLKFHIATAAYKIIATGLDWVTDKFTANGDGDESSLMADLENAQQAFENDRIAYNQRNGTNVSSRAYTDVRRQDAKNIKKQENQTIKEYLKAHPEENKAFKTKAFKKEILDKANAEIAAKSNNVNTPVNNVTNNTTDANKTEETKAVGNGIGDSLSLQDSGMFSNKNIMDSLPKDNDITKSISKGKDTKSEMISDKEISQIVNNSDSDKNAGYGDLQSDSKWGNMSLGKFASGRTSTMENAGCGMTALSNAINQVGGNTNPGKVASVAKSNNYIAGGGASTDLFDKGASKLGVSATRVDGNGLVNSLSHGKPVVLSGQTGYGPGDDNTSPYTRAGHVITATGFDRNGNVKVSDPMRGNYSTPLSNITNGMKAGWRVDNKSSGYGSGDENKESSSGNKDVRNNAIYWAQMDPRWANLPFAPSGERIGPVGCLMTSTAMGVSNVSDRVIPPDEAAKIAIDAYSNYGNFNNTALAEQMAKAGDVDVETVTSMDDAIAKLKKRIPIMMFGNAANNNPFQNGNYNGTHAMLAVGATEDGSGIIFNDPGDTSGSRTSGVAFPKDQVYNALVNKATIGRAYSKDGKGIPSKLNTSKMKLAYKSKVRADNKEAGKKLSDSSKDYYESYDKENDTSNTLTNGLNTIEENGNAEGKSFFEKLGLGLEGVMKAIGNAFQAAITGNKYKSITEDEEYMQKLRGDGNKTPANTGMFSSAASDTESSIGNNGNVEYYTGKMVSESELQKSIQKSGFQVTTAGVTGQVEEGTQIGPQPWKGSSQAKYYNYMPDDSEWLPEGGQEYFNGQTLKGAQAYNRQREPWLLQDLNTYRHITAEELQNYAKEATGNSLPEDNPYYTRGDVFVQLGQRAGIDPRYLLAHSAIESDWGRSKLARDKNNYFGIDAVNGRAYEAGRTFDGGEDGFYQGITQGGEWINRNYLENGQNSLAAMLSKEKAHSYAMMNNHPNYYWGNMISRHIMNMSDNEPPSGLSPDAENIPDTQEEKTEGISQDTSNQEFRVGFGIGDANKAELDTDDATTRRNDITEKIKRSSRGLNELNRVIDYDDSPSSKSVGFGSGAYSSNTKSIENKLDTTNDLLRKIADNTESSGFGPGDSKSSGSTPDNNTNVVLHSEKKGNKILPVVNNSNNGGGDRLRKVHTMMCAKRPIVT